MNSKELISNNKEKTWTTLSARISQADKIAVLKRADSEGLNQNQFVLKIVSDYMNGDLVYGKNNIKTVEVEKFVKVYEPVGVELETFYMELIDKIKEIYSLMQDLQEAAIFVRGDYLQGVKFDESKHTSFDWMINDSLLTDPQKYINTEVSKLKEKYEALKDARKRFE